MASGRATDCSREQERGQGCYWDSGLARMVVVVVEVEVGEVAGF